MNKRLSCLSGLLFFLFYTLNAQLPYLQFYQQNWSWINPAAIDRGFILPCNNNRNPSILHLSSRQQWLGVEGAPRSYSIGFEHNPMVVPGGESFHLKWGGQIFNENIGNFNTIGGYLNFAYSLKFKGTRNSRLFIGINAGVVNTSFGQLDLNTYKDPNDLVLNIVEGANSTFADIGFGLFYQKDQSFYAGLSIPRLANPLEVSLGNNIASDYLIPQTGFVSPVYLVLGGFLGAGIYESADFILEPSIWVRYVRNSKFYTLLPDTGIPVGVDLNIRGYLRQKLWMGVGYSSNRHFSLDFGTMMPLNFTENAYDQLRINLGVMIPVLANGINFGPSIELGMAYSWN